MLKKSMCTILPSINITQNAQKPFWAINSNFQLSGLSNQVLQILLKFININNKILDQKNT